ncbi:Hok/Gef family protein [Erwinia sp. CGal63]
MKQRTAILIAIIVIVAATAVLLVTRKDLCEVRLRTGDTEIAVFMDYEPR